jgi:CHAT domain-containing protein
MLLAGAHEVVASLWDVDSSATSAWNRAFYRQIAQGEPPVNAMKVASEQLRAMPQWQSPKYWAGFALYQQ